MLLWMMLPFAWADCPELPLDQMRSSAAAMEVAFATLDEPGFDAARAELDTALPCVDETLIESDILALHRAVGLARFMDGDMVASKKSWGAVRTLAPDWQPPPSLIPDGHLLRTLFDQAPLADDTVDLDLAPPGGWLVDGAPATSVPASRAFVMQGFGEESEVVHTGYHHSVAEIPVLDFARPIPRLSERAKKMRRYGSLGAGAALLVGGGLVGASVLTRKRLPDVPYDKVDGAITRADVLAGTGVGLGVVAVGLGTTAWVVKW